MAIRPMVNDDYDRVYTLWCDTEEVGLRSLDDSREGLSRFLNRNPGTSFVALQGDEIVGTILCGHDGRRGYLYHLTVASGCRRKGWGKALVDAALSALKREGIHKAALIVFHNNDGGNAFWESVGFVQRSDLFYRNISLNDQNV